MATTDVGTGAITAAAVLAFSYGGVTMEHLLLGTGCFMVGSACRFGVRVGTALESGAPPQIGRALAAFSVSPMLAAFSSMVMFFASHIVGFEGDAAMGILLALAGFRGSEGIQWVVSIVSNMLPDKLVKAGKQEPHP